MFGCEHSVRLFHFRVTFFEIFWCLSGNKINGDMFRRMIIHKCLTCISLNRSHFKFVLMAVASWCDYMTSIPSYLLSYNNYLQYLFKKQYWCKELTILLAWHRSVWPSGQYYTQFMIDLCFFFKDWRFSGCCVSSKTDEALKKKNY